MNYNEEYQRIKNIFEKEYYKFADEIEYTDTMLFGAMKYSMKSNGKRLRPVLFLAVCELLNLDIETAVPFAISIELIHTYSLIHDDLPSMDNDDFRRGNPTCHKVYGEAMAILTGDALLNLAYENIFKNCDTIDKYKAFSIFAECAGYTGMIGGQAKDVRLTNKFEVEENDLIFIHKNKTAKLFLGCVLMASKLAHNMYYEDLEKFAINFGMLFQATDDLLDCTSNFEELGKSVGKDYSDNKLTFVSFYGLEKTKEKINEYKNNCINILNNIHNTYFLKELVYTIYDRKK